MLAGDVRDQVEVVVVVQHDELCCLGSRGDEQVGDLRASLPALGGQRVLDLNGTVEDPLIKGDGRPCRPFRWHRPSRCSTSLTR